MKKIKKRRRFIAFLCFLVLIGFLLYWIFRKEDYTITYTENDFQIEETYSTEENSYSFLLKKEDREYFTVLFDRHFFSDHLIYQVEEFTTDTESCVVLSSQKIRFLPLCLANEEQVSFHLISQEMKEQIGISDETFGQSVDMTYNNISISNTLYHTFYIWNYRGFYRINADTQEEITLFQKDIYTPNLLTKVGDYLFIPDYEANYYFQKAYLLNMKTGEVETWSMPNSIYFDSIVLGVYEDSLYLVDRHESVEWQIDVSNRQMTKVSTSEGGITYQNGFVDVSMNRLMYQDNSFQGVLPITYQIQDGLKYTYKDYSIQLLYNSPKSIVSYDMDWVYYLVDDSLYAYSLDYGEIFLMKYFEWNFNYTNVVFIY